ncbi:hypothetical protein EC973_004606 [Apophysomyces ossiformis]|uniref:Arrestin C-terminal-like domain-containing protein n=1 Tax=Apophysomyces ossiformis TaxID=679940 RepID=A0A8H7ET70_9FUNG|nr:hypothetical protein EC973_004606 [Apophysomyces ossiformis]
MLAAPPNTAVELSVVLLPEFGWTIQGQPVYGPGSVFQGFVQLDLKQPIMADRIRLVFHASESTFERGYHEQFFGTQRVLWDSKANGTLLEEPSNRFYFTIQMPLVQFPPSMQTEQYRCAFRLTAHLDLPGNQSIQEQKPVLYMPFIETCLLKTPLELRDTKHDTTAMFKVNALDYVPGDRISGTLVLDKETAKVTMKLLQVSTLLNGNQRSIKLISSNVYKLNTKRTEIVLELPQNITPSFSYGRIMTIAYKLRIQVEQKGAFRPKYSSFELPITVGTLGYGIRASDELQLYTSFRSVFDAKGTASGPVLPVPRFMRCIEYEESLPVYEPERLPSYETSISC